MELNEKGSALLICIGIMVLFSIIGISLMTFNQNRNAQVVKNHDTIIATNMAEIGIKNAEGIIRNSVKETKYEEVEVLNEEIQHRILVGQTYQVDENGFFRYEIKELDLQEFQLVLTVTSIGTYQGEESKIDGTFTIHRVVGKNAFPSVTNKDHYVSERRGKIRQTWTGDYYFDTFHLRSNSEVKIYGNLKISSKLIQEANTNLIVYKNSYIRESDVKVNQSNNGNLGFFCTQGTLYYYGSQPDVFTIPEGKTCDQLNAQKPPLNGIYAKNIEYIPESEFTDPYWDESSIDVVGVYY